MKPLIVASLLALAAPAAQAGDLKIGFGFGYHSDGGLSIQLGLRKSKHHAPARRVHRVHRVHRPVVRHVRYVHRPVIRHYCERVWVPGHYATVERRVWVPGCVERIWNPPVYEWRRDRCGNRIRVLVRDGYYTEVQRPGHYEIRTERVWTSGTYTYTCDTPGHRH